MARGSQFIRQWTVLSILSARRFGCTLKELAEELECHARTVRRDVEVLETGGFPVERERDPATREVRIRLPQQYRAPNIPFTLTEVLSFYFARNVLDALRGTPMKEGLDTALRKIERTLPVHVLDHVTLSTNALLSKPGPTKDYRGHVEALLKVQQAVADRRKLQIHYRAYGRPKAEAHVFRPYCVTHCDGSLYVIGHSELRGAMRTLLLDRMERVGLLDERFEVPEDFDAEEHLAEGFGIWREDETHEVRIEFAKAEAQFIKERQWHPTQRIEELKDGRLILTMRVSGLLPVVRWVLSYGDGARALAPPALVEQIAQQLRNAAEQYPEDARNT